MPADTTTFTIGDVIDDLDQRRRQAAARAAATDGTTPDLDELGTTLDQRLADFEDLAEEYGQEPAVEAFATEQGRDPATISFDDFAAEVGREAAVEAAREHGRDEMFEIGELTVSDRVEFGDLLEATREQQRDRRGIEGGSDTRDLLWTAAGVVDAPWLDIDDDDDAAMQKRVAAFRGLEDYWHVVQFLKERVTEVNAKGNPERKSYAELCAAETQANAQN